MNTTSKKRQWIYGSHAILFLLLSAVILAAVNYLANAHPKRWDLTEYKENSLSDQTIKILSGLEEPIKIFCFYKNDDSDARSLKSLLDIYQYHSDKVEVEFVDPDLSPALTEKYGVQTYQTIMVTQGGRRERAALPNESKITNAILRTAKEKDKHIYFLEGHGEHDLAGSDQNGYAEVKKAIETDAYQISLLSLATMEKMPDDCSVLVIAGPTKDFFGSEIQIIGDYLDQGGRVFLLIDPGPIDQNLSELIINWGVQIENDRIIDPLSVMRGADFFVPVVETYDPFHAVTKDFQNVYTVFPLARSLRVMTFADKGLMCRKLAQTGQGTWGETRSDSIFYDEESDRIGPLNIAMSVERQRNLPEQSESDTTLPNTRMIIIGDSDFANNVYFYQHGNSDFFMNALSWLAGEEDLISVRAKEPHERRLNLTILQAQLLFWLSVVLIPLMVSIAGFIVWWIKR
ncbi:MAG: hypothetical protein B6244_06645 [Candidatus Cloacimonetes bacterium 4572_55]|nr:MAG: hypothetical protein B6244_06645 [Candidatus Cloacimonetes bacterium 4572_55]